MKRLSLLAAIVSGAILISGCGRPPGQAAASPTAKASAKWSLEFVEKVQSISYPPAAYPAELQPKTFSVSVIRPVPASSARIEPKSPGASARVVYYAFGNGFYALTARPDGSIWFSSSMWSSSSGNHPWFGYFGSDGSVRSYLVSGPERQGGYIATTPDGSIWIGQDGFIGRLSASLTYTQFAIHGRPGRLTPAPDNALWTEEIDSNGDNRVLRITPTGEETDYQLPKKELAYGAARAVWGPDGAIWLASNSGIGRLTTDGSYYRLRLQGQATDLGFGPDGNLWVVTIFEGGYAAALQEWRPPGDQVASQPLDFGSQIITVGGDGTVWFQGIARNSSGVTSWLVGRLQKGRLEVFSAFDAIEMDQVLVGDSFWYSGLGGVSRFTPPS
jgi:streptogramin lyase